VSVAKGSVAQRTRRNVVRYSARAAAAEQRPLGTMRGCRASVVVFLLLASCKQQEVVFPTSPPETVHTEFKPLELQESQWFRDRIAPCRVILPEIKEVGGGGATSCTDAPSQAEAIDCANRQFRRRAGFTLCRGGWGMDSLIEVGVAGSPEGDLAFVYFDGMGPAYRGGCPREKVALSVTGWPRCTVELTNKTDLRTGKPYAEFWDEFESWSPGCEARALRATREPSDIKLRKRVQLLSDPNQWNRDCSRLSLSLHVLIDREGRVVCTAVPKKLEPHGLSLELRRNLGQLRFDPPRVYGVPVEARWGLTATGCNPLNAPE